MKKLQLLVFLSAISITAWVQNESAKQPAGANANAYAKGNWRNPLMQNLRFGFYSTDYNDKKYSTENNLDFRIETDYFVANGWAIGADVSYSGSKTKYESGTNDELKESDWTAALSILYGMPIVSNKLYWNARIGYGLGGNHEEEKSSTGTTKDDIDISKLFFVAGVDIRNANSNVFINPWVGYDMTNKDYSNDDKEDFNSFKFGVRLISSMACSEHICDLKTKCSVSRNMYDKGRSFIGYTTKGMFSFGSYDVDEANNQGGYKGNYNEGHVRLDYNYYVLNYFAAGIVGMYQYTKDKGKDFDFESTNNSFNIGPKITVQIPVDNCWRNFFGEVGATFGGETNEYKSGASNTKIEASTTNIWGGIGYNFVVSPNISFTPIFNYGSMKEKDKDTDNEFKRSGANFRFGLRYMF